MINDFIKMKKEAILGTEVWAVNVNELTYRPITIKSIIDTYTDGKAERYYCAVPIKRTISIPIDQRDQIAVDFYNSENVYRTSEEAIKKVTELRTELNDNEKTEVKNER